MRSISASSPRASGSSVASVSWRASRIASPARSTRPAWPGRVDEVEHAQHDGEVAGLVQAAGGGRQGALGPADPLRHRRLGHVEGVGDLPGGEAADGAQGQRHLGGGREVGVAAAEEQEEGVVALLGERPPGRGSACVASSRRCRAASLRRASTSRRVATVVSHARGSRGGCSGHTRSASSSASCSASSAASKSSPRRTRPASTRGTRARSAPSSSRRVGSSITPRQSSEGAPGHDLPDVDPLVQRLAARAGLGGDVGRELERALVRLDVDHVPARDEVAGLGVRAVGGDGRGVRAAVAHPGARRRERLRVDVLAVLLEQLADVPAGRPCAPPRPRGPTGPSGGTGWCGSGPPR